MKKQLVPLLMILIAATASAQDNPSRIRLEQTANEFINMYNTGDSTVYRNYLSRSVPPTRMPDLLRRYGNTWSSVGPVDVGLISYPSDRKAEILAREKKYGSWWKFTVETDSLQQFMERTVQPIPLPEEGLDTVAVKAAAVPSLLDDYITKRLGKDFAGNVFIENKHGVLYNRSFGSDQQGIANNKETVFGLASAGKMFTGVAIFQLVAKGRLSLDDTVGSLIPAITNRQLHSITVGQLLTHSSGLGDFFERPEYREAPPSTDDPSTILPIINGEQLLFPPGKGWAYSNTGFLLLGVIVEKASGLRFDHYVSKYIFQPMQMTRSIAGSGAGGGRSTVDDMRKFLHGFRDAKLLDAETTALISDYTINGSYGYATEHHRLGGEQIVGHSGGFINECVELNIYRSTGNLVIILSNSNPPFGHFLSGRIKSILLHR